jgi:hypothetical protein
VKIKKVFLTLIEGVNVIKKFLSAVKIYKEAVRIFESKAKWSIVRPYSLKQLAKYKKALAFCSSVRNEVKKELRQYHKCISPEVYSCNRLS